MIYLCGSDLESKTGAATKDLEEIVSSGVNTDLVNVVVMAGGTTQWQNDFSHEETAVYALTAGSGSADGETAGSGGTGGAGTGLTWEKKETFDSPDQENAPANMGESGTLKSFLDYSHDRFPADRYALILWDHGGGPMRGLCWDTAWAKDGLTMEELTGALKDSPFAAEKLSWIGFDACLMSSVETAHLIAPYAEYMIASEETEPCVGWSYDYLAGIEKDKNGGETGVRIIDSFMAAGQAASEAADKDSSLTLSCMDLAQLVNVEEKIDSFFAELDESLSPESFSELSNLREDTREFGKAMNDSQRYDLVDLGDLVAHYEDQAPDQAAALKEALDQMVVYSKSNLDNCSGLSSYHPYYNKTYYEKMWRDVYDSFAFAPSYTEYIKKFAQIWLGDAMGDWTQMSQVQPAGTEGETQYFSVQLTPEQVQYYADSELLLLSKSGDEEETIGPGYLQVYRTDEVTLDENGILTAGYNGRTLYAVDENDKIIAGPLGYTISDDGNLQIQTDFINDESGTEQEFVRVLYECADAPAGTDLPILEKYVGDVETGAWSNRMEFDESEYKTAYFLYSYKEPVYDGERIMPFSEWEISDRWGGYEVLLTEALRFRFYDRILDGSQLFACFEISDTQANIYGTELMEFQNPNLTAIRFEEGIYGGETQEPENRDSDLHGDENTQDDEAAAGGNECVFSNDDLRIRVSGNLDTSQETASLRLHFVYENLSDQDIEVSLDNGVRISDASRTRVCLETDGGADYNYIEPGETIATDIEYNGKVLAGLSSLEQISFVLNCEKGLFHDEWDEAQQWDADMEEETEGIEETEDIEEREDLESESEGTVQKLEVVLHPIDLNVSAISGSKEYTDNPEGLAVCRKDQILWTIHSVEQQRGGDIELAVVVKNESSESAAMKFPQEISINGILMAVSGINIPYDANGIIMDDIIDERLSDDWTLNPGEECSFIVNAENSQYMVGAYEHLGGSTHLLLSDILGTEGVSEVQTVSFYLEDTYMYGFIPSEGEGESSPVHFALSEPVHLNKDENSRFMRDDSERISGEGDQDSLSAEEMTKALDFGGKTPVRTEIYSRDGITVYGEHILIADQTILMSFILENKSDEDRVVRFYGINTNDMEGDTFSIDELSYASSRRRIILESYNDLEFEDESINNMSMIIWQDTKGQQNIDSRSEEKENPDSGQRDGNDGENRTRGLPIIRQVDLSFPTGTAFNVDGGKSFGFEETAITVNCLTDEKIEGDIFEKKVACPENPDQYRKPVSFTLPDSLSQEEKESVTDVTVTAYRDCTAEISPEDKENVWFWLSAAEVEDSSPLFLQSLVSAGMKKSEEKTDTFSGTLSGLICVHQDDPNISYVMLESNDADGKTRFVKRKSDTYDYWYLRPAEWVDDTVFAEEYDMTITLQDDSASLEEFFVYTSDFDFDEYAIPYFIAPVNWFESMDIALSATTFVHAEDGSLVREPDAVANAYYNRVYTEIPVSCGEKTLELLPFEECGSEIRLLYTVYFEDGSSRTYDGGSLF